MRREPRRETGQGAARTDRAADDVELLRDLRDQLHAAPYGQGVAATFGDQVEVPELLAKLIDHRGLGLAAIGLPVEVGQAHPAVDGESQRRVQRVVRLAADHTDRLEPEQRARGRDGPDVVGVRAAERQQRRGSRRPGGLEVVPELAPLVARQLRMDQVVPLEQEPHPGRRQAIVVDLLDG